MRRIAVSMAAWLLAIVPGVVRAGMGPVREQRPTFSPSIFPSEPKALNIAYTSEFGVSLAGHVLQRRAGPKPLHDDRRRLQRRGEDSHGAERSSVGPVAGQGDACQNDWRSDVQGSMIFAASKFVKRAPARRSISSAGRPWTR